VRLSETEYAEIKRRAGTHKVPVGAYLRSAALGTAHDPTGVARSADEWWPTETAERRDGLWRWVKGIKHQCMALGEQKLPGFDD